MKQAKLKVLFDYLPKSKVQAGDGLAEGMYPFYTSSENQTKYLNEYQHGPGCLIFGTGGKASVHFTTSHFSTSIDCITIKPKPEVEIDAGYVFQYFKGNMQVLENGFKGAGLKHISKAYLSDIEIPYPEEIDDQRRIAHLLGKVEGLIAQRKQHLQQLDDLVKSVFLEMFGDIKKQISSHPFLALRPYLKANSGKSSKGVQAGEKTDIPIYGGNGINGWATKALYQEPVIIAGRVGQQCGVIHISEGPCWVTDNAIVLSIQDKDRLNIRYLATAFQHAPIRQKVQQLDLPFINQSMLLDYPLPLPPIELQNHLAAIIEKTEGIRSVYQKSLVDLKALYGALSQQAFKGELDLSRVPLPRQADETSDLTKQARMEPTTPTSFQLPDSEAPDWLAVENRPKLFEFWLTAWCERYAEESFAASRFMDAAYQRLVELSERGAFQFDKPGKGFDEAKWYEEPAPFGFNEYEQIKKWVFEALASGKLTQGFDDTDNLIQLKAAQA